MDIRVLKFRIDKRRLTNDLLDSVSSLDNPVGVGYLAQNLASLTTKCGSCPSKWVNRKSWTQLRIDIAWSIAGQYTSSFLCTVKLSLLDAILIQIDEQAHLWKVCTLPDYRKQRKIEYALKMLNKSK